MKNNIRVAIVTLLLIAVCSVPSIGYQVTSVSAASNYSTSTILVKPSFTTSNRTSKSVKLNINGITGVSGYKVYRSVSKSKGFAYVGSTKNNTFTDNKLKANKTYYYKVRAFIKLKGKKINSSYSDVKMVSKYVAKNTTSTNTNTTTSKNTQTQTNVGSNSTTVNKTTNNQTTTSQSTTNANSNLASQVLVLVNKERAKAGLKALTTTTSLANAGNLRAKEIVSNFSHTRPNGSSPFTVFNEYNVSYNTAGENIAYGQKTPEAVMNAWMNSPGHKANIMNGKFGKVGIGVYVKNGTIYWTQLFTN